jgi:hypothetical protein
MISSRSKNARDSIGLRWNECEEGDRLEGEGTAVLLDDGTTEIEFACHSGDEAVLKAKQPTSSTACWGPGSPIPVRKVQ